MVRNMLTFNRRELLDIGVKDFTYSTWWAESGYGGYQMNLTYDFGTYSYGDDNYYYGYKGYSDAIIGGKDLSRKNYSNLGILGGMINVGGYAGGTATLVGGAAKQTNIAFNVVNEVRPLSPITKIANAGAIIGGVGFILNATNNFLQAETGVYSTQEAWIRTGVSAVEFGLAFVLYVGPILSIILVAYDLGGGFDNNLYSIGKP